MTPSRDRPDLREQLLAVDARGVAPSARERYEKEVAAMLAEPLQGKRKVSTILSIVLLSVTIVLFVVLGIHASLLPNAPRWTPLPFALGTAFAAAWIVRSVRILRRGSFDRMSDPMYFAGLGWALVVFVGTIVMVGAGQYPHRPMGLQAMVIILFFAICAGLILLRTVIEQSELRTRQKLLELELRLTELSDQLRKPD